MDNITFRWIGWCNEGTSDKIWASFKINDSFYAMWGARGKAVNFKKHDTSGDLLLVERSKKKKYTEVGKDKIVELWPDFYEQVNKRLVYCLMCNHIK